MSGRTAGVTRSHEPNGRGPASATRVFGIDVETAAPAELLRRITGYVEEGGTHLVTYANAHVLNRSIEDVALRDALHAADLVYCDGYGVRLAAWAIGDPIPERMTGADWVWGLAPLCETAGHTLYLLGSEADVAREAGARLRRWYPRLRIVGHHHGFFDPQSAHNERVIEDIASKRPDILLLGMGTPKQETWAMAERHRLEARVVWCVGSLFDYVAGRMPRAPHVLADHGLEWIFRLGLQPRRMWRRYLIGNPVFLGRVGREIRRRSRSGEPGPASPPASPGPR